MTRVCLKTVVTDQPFTVEMKTVVFVFLLSVHCELTTALKRQHYFINEAKTWSDAQRYCRQNYADLSCVNDTPALLGLKSAINTGNIGVLSQSGNPYYVISAWIGLKKTSSNDWNWSDRSLYNAELSVLSNNNTDNGCAYFYMNLLYAYNCENQNAFFCYKWVPDLILVKENKSWEDALQHCRTHYTDLASLPSYLHLIQAKQTSAIAETASVWTGLRFLSGSWFWLSGEKTRDLVQLPACPANHSYCGSLNRTTWRWNNRDCVEKLNFVCY